MATIDLTERYDRERYLAGGRRAWTLDRSAKPVRAIVVHHSAAFYGPRLGLAATGDEELVQLDALAADHHARFGVGPGYHYVAFPSGRLYAVGKAGTHRAHTKGRNPASGERWNVEAIGVCAMGDYEAGEPSAPLLATLTEAVGEIRGYGFAESALIPVHAHGLAPTVDASGRPFSQATACPGRHFAPLASSLNAGTPASLDRDAVRVELAPIRRAADAIEELLAGA